MHLASVIVRMNAIYGSEDKYNDYITGLRKIKEVDERIMRYEIGDLGNIERFCKQFVRNHANNRKIAPNFDISNKIIDSFTSGYKEITFAADAKKDYELSPIMCNKGKPFKFVTITRKEGTKLKRELYMLNSSPIEYAGKIEVTYVKTSSLGLVNNFIEYDANSDLPESYFAAIGDDSTAAFEDEDELDTVTREDASDTGELHDTVDVNRGTFLAAIKEFPNELTTPEDADKETNSKYKKLRSKVWEAIQQSAPGSKIRNALVQILNQELKDEERTKAASVLAEAAREQMKEVKKEKC